MHRHRLFSSGNTYSQPSYNASRLLLISAFFFVGCLFGAFFGANSSAVILDKFGFLGSTSGGDELISHIFLFVWFHLLAILLGTSYLGVVFIPLLTVLKGFAFSFASATIMTSVPSRGIIMVLIVLGIPSLFSIPAFFAMCDDGFFRSAKLLSLLRGNSSALTQKSDGKIFIYAFLLFLGVLADLKLSPYLLSLLT